MYSKLLVHQHDSAIYTWSELGPITAEERCAEAPWEKGGMGGRWATVKIST